MSRVSFYTRPYDRLEPYDGKLSRTVLRGGAGSNASLLPDIRSEKDILKLVNALIMNTKGEGEKSSEDFWVKAERLYYSALIGYIWYEATEEEKNFITLLDLINASEAREDDETYQSPVELLSRCWSSSLPKSSRLSRSYRAVIFSFFLITCAPFFGFRLCVLRDFPTA